MTERCPPTFCVKQDTHPAEQRADSKRMKELKRAVEVTGNGAVVHIEDAVRCRDLWRIPVSFSGDQKIRLELAHFLEAKRLGAHFIVEECFSEDQMNAFFLEMPRSRISGWKAMSIRERVLCIIYCILFLVGLIGVASHVFPYFSS